MVKNHVSALALSIQTERFLICMTKIKTHAFRVFAIVVVAALAFALGLWAATLLFEAASAAVKELGGCPEL